MLCIALPFMKLSNERLDAKINELRASCAVGPFLESTLVKSHNHHEFKLLSSIVRRSNPSQLCSRNPSLLVVCAVKVLLKYSATPVHLEAHLNHFSREHHRELVESQLNRLLLLFKANHSKEVIEAIIRVLESDDLWRARRFCAGVTNQIVSNGLSGALLSNTLCDALDRATGHRKPLVRVLYELLDSYAWPDEPTTTLFLERLLLLYRATLREDSEMGKLRGSLELCVRHIARNVPQSHLILIVRHMASWSIGPDVVCDNVIASYGSALEFVAAVHRGSSVLDSFGEGLLPQLMDMIASSERFVSLLGNRVFQYLLDRDENRAFFSAPKIFFEGAKVNLTIGTDNDSDTDFLKGYRELIHSSLIKSFINHSQSRLNLETTYCTLCLIAVQIPCGFTAATLSCIVMGLQNAVRKNAATIGKEATYHLHAIIISILTLICWVHKAEHFHVYVYGIVMERAQWAPHLNPPLRSNYHFAVHHVLWDKPELFIVDWEVRYGLWKRFRLGGLDTPRSHTVTHKHHPPSKS